ncbi:MAG: ORF6N domain-containing protein [bacterium]
MTKLSRISEIKAIIIELRGEKIILDRDLAKIYGVSTKRLNEQVKRNLERFPADFMFQLTEEEKDEVVAICDHLSQLKFSPQLPYAFTRNGANMLSAILKNPAAVRRSIQIMRAFSVLEEMMGKKRKTLTKSPDVLVKLSMQSKAIMHLFQKDKIKTKEIKKIKKVVSNMIIMMQNIVLGM